MDYAIKKTQSKHILRREQSAGAGARLPGNKKKK